MSDTILALEVCKLCKGNGSRICVRDTSSAEEGKPPSMEYLDFQSAVPMIGWTRIPCNVCKGTGKVAR